MYVILCLSGDMLNINDKKLLYYLVFILTIVFILNYNFYIGLETRAFWNLGF